MIADPEYRGLDTHSPPLIHWQKPTTAVARSIPFRRRQPIVHVRERGHETLLDLPADYHQPLLGAVSATLGLHEVGLQAAEASINFDPHAIKVLVRVGLSARD